MGKRAKCKLLKKDASYLYVDILTSTNDTTIKKNIKNGVAGTFAVAAGEGVH